MAASSLLFIRENLDSANRQMQESGRESVAFLREVQHITEGKQYKLPAAHWRG